MRRVSAVRLRTKRTMLIFGEGQTEPLYFSALKLEPVVREGWNITVKKGDGWSPESVVREAVKFRKRDGFDEVWCVLDVEGADKEDSVKAAIEIATKNNINLCWSNPCIEVWFLVHFGLSPIPHNDCGNVITKLDLHWKREFGVEYDKTDDDHYVKLRPRLEAAVEKMKRIVEENHDGKPCTKSNPSTEVHALVSKLLKLA
jgi:hypothetical protein